MIRHIYWLLFALPSCILVNQIRSTHWEDAAKHTVLLVFAVGVGWAEYAFCYQFWDLIGTIPLGYVIVLPRFLSFMGSYLFAFLAYSSLLTALSSLYQSDDLTFLLSTAVKLPVILAYKWFDIAVRSASTLVFLSIPPMIALAQVLDLSILFCVMYLVSVLLISCMAVCVGVWIAMIMAMVFPAKRMHQTIALLGLMIAALLIMGIRFLHLETLWTDQAMTNPLIVLLRQEPSGLWQYAPGKLFSLSVTPFLHVKPEWFWMSIHMVCSFTAFLGTVMGAQRIFMRGWWRSREQQDPQIRRHLPVRNLFPFVLVPPSIRVMIWKDYLTLKRDPTVWTQLFMMLPLAVIYLLNLAFLPLKGSEIITYFAIANVGLIGLIIAAVGARFLFPVASREGKSIWIPYSSPVSASTVILQKLLFSTPPVFLLSATLLFCSNFVLSLPDHLFYWCIGYGLFLTFTICVMAVLLGFCFPMYRYKHVLEVSLGKGSFLFMVVSIIQITMLMYWAYRYVLTNPYAPLPFIDPVFACWAVGCLLVLIGLYRVSIYRWIHTND